MEKTLWAVRIGAENWQEELITSTTDAKHLENAKEWAIANGFDRIRVSEFDFKVKPDFSKTVTLKD